MNVYDRFKKLNKAEQEFIWAHPFVAATFDANSETAYSEAQKRFAAASLHNGSGDAFRHCFWCAMNARDHGQVLARQFGDAHEAWDGNPEQEKKMDLHNNGIGYAIGASSPGASDRHLAVLCTQAWASKRLLQIDSSKEADLVYSNSIANFAYGAGK